MTAEFKIKRLVDDVVLPAKGYQSDAGFDLFLPKDVRLTQKPQLIKLGFSMSLPVGYEGQIRPRSSSALRGIYVPLGTIDPGYRGEVGLIAWTHYPSLTVEKGSRIAQMVIAQLPPVYLASVAELPDSERGSNGFGSTG